MSHQQGTTKVILFAFFANLGIAMAKFFGAWWTLSSAMLAEAVHSLVDCCNQLLLLLGQKRSKKAADEKHPLGYGREAFFWGFVVSILLFSMGGMFAIYEGIHKLKSPEESNQPLVALAILVISVLLEAGSFWSCLKEVKIQKGNLTFWRWFKKSTSAELIIVFMEDLAALVGLLIALVAVTLSWLTKSPVYDSIGSMAVGSLLIVVAVLLAIETQSLLIGEASDLELEGDLQNIFDSFLPGAKLLKLIVVQAGPGEVLLSCKFDPGHTNDVRKLIQQMNLIEIEVKRRFPQVRWQFLEPDDKS